ncbi:MAG: hypothetical protein HY720_01625 [Planctomycetes bacterium]|nr:hypothetical protein [Planctomycetota bacterium]
MNTTPCPCCAEEIEIYAMKCRWCREIVDPALPAAGAPPAMQGRHSDA